jgi:hypothetical protein
MIAGKVILKMQVRELTIFFQKKKKKKILNHPALAS